MDVTSKIISTGLKKLIGKDPENSKMIAIVEKQIEKRVVKYDKTNLSYNQKIKCAFLNNSIEQSLKNIKKGYFSHDYAARVVETLVLNNFFKRNSKKARNKYKEKYGIEAPSFCAVSPTKRCNLNCIGCYAGSNAKTAETLEYPIFKKFLDEMHDIIGARFIVISGGEPTTYKSEGKDILDIVGEYPDTFFLMYTNGTLIDNKTAERMRDLGNITPAISVEGYEKETDERRGKGIYKKIMTAMDNLRKAKVPFGISVTATKKNVDLLLTDDFYEHYFENLGALYMWQFHLMPIGRAKDSMELMISAEDRINLYKKWEKLLFEKHYFIGDFWNSSGASDGCIAYARNGGYFYVDWNGNISPCVFVPYAKDNLYDLYKNGKSIADALNSDYFVRGRKWQKDYGYGKKDENIKNWLAPCSIRDHYDNFRRNILIEKDNIKPIDEFADQSLKDKEYYKRMVKFDDDLEKLSEPIWKEKYINSKCKQK